MGIHDKYANTAEFYDYVTPYRNRNDVRFFVDAARESGGPVLEIGCGTGRVLIPIAEEGIAITGLDASPSMLERCRKKVSSLSPAVQGRIHLVEGDMTGFDLGTRFSLVVFPFRPFQHLTTVEEQVRCLQEVHRHLLPGGTLILDVFNPSLTVLTAKDSDPEAVPDAEFDLPDGGHVIRRSRVVRRDLFQQIVDCELLYEVTYPDGRTREFLHAFPMRYLFRFEVEHLLHRCGFHLETVYADYNKAPFGTRDPGELICVAHKPQ